MAFRNFKIPNDRSVLILDAEGRSALACIRSLGRKAVPIVVASHESSAPGFHSRFARNRPICTYTNPLTDMHRFVDDVADICRRHNVGLIFPQSEKSLCALLESREKWPQGVTIPMANDHIFYGLQDKLAATELMKGFDLQVPLIWRADSIVDNPEDVSFPCLMKPRKSVRVVGGNCLEKLDIKWIADEASLAREIQRPDIDQYFFQEYKKGHGGAIYLLMWGGKCLARVDQITLRQQAGPGAVTKAFSGSDLFPGIAVKVQSALESVEWNGVIMVELRIDPDDNQSYFIECNPRFWGPTQLAIDSGVDIPYLLYRAANGLTSQPVQKVQPVGYSWIIGHWYSRLFEKIGKRSDFFQPTQHNECPATAIKKYRDIYFRLEDPMPALFELKRTLFKKSWTRISGRLRSGW